MIPTPFASWPMYVCVVPTSFPCEKRSRRVSSKRRMKNIRS